MKHRHSPRAGANTAHRRHFWPEQPPLVRRNLAEQPITRALETRHRHGLTITEIDWTETQ